MELNPESTVVQAGVPDEDHAVHGDLLGVVEVDIAGLHGGAIDVVLDLELQGKHVEGVQHCPELTAVSGQVPGDALIKYFLDRVLRQPGNIFTTLKITVTLSVCSRLFSVHFYHFFCAEFRIYVLISSILESYPGLCLGQSVTQSLTLSTIFLPNERENNLVSSVCTAARYYSLVVNWADHFVTVFPFNVFLN